jgi:hypothetical protein
MEIKEGQQDVAGTSTEELVAKIYHTDGRVNAIEGKLDTQGQQLNRIENAILNKQPTWNNTAIMGLVIGVGAFLVGITSYVDLQLTPIKDVVVSDAAWKRDKDEFQRATHYRYGEYETWQKIHQKTWEHHDELYHKLDERVRTLEQQHQYGMAIIRERSKIIERDENELRAIDNRVDDHLQKQEHKQ